MKNSIKTTISIFAVLLLLTSCGSTQKDVVSRSLSGVEKDKVKKVKNRKTIDSFMDRYNRFDRLDR